MSIQKHECTIAITTPEVLLNAVARLLQENQGGPRDSQAPALPPIAEAKAAGKSPSKDAQQQQQSCLDGLWQLLSQTATLLEACPVALAQALQLLLALCQASKIKCSSVCL